MSSTTFPNGQTLVSSALTPKALLTILQQLTVGILGINPATDPQAYSKVRIDWPTQGQPAWDIDEDRCFLSATPANDAFSQVRDQIINVNNTVSVTQNMAFTQVWNTNWCFYGPNAYDHVRLVASAITFDWVNDTLSSSNLYPVARWYRPDYVPELFNGQWWPRADLRLQMNEFVSESISVPTAESVDVTLIKEDGLTTSFTIQQ